MRYADLHTHTHHSDGTRSPREVVDVARAHGIDILSISDHDHLAGFYEIKPYADQVGITLIPGIELSCIHEGVDIHVLAYAFNAEDPILQGQLQEFRRARVQRGYKMVARLLNLGYPIPIERVVELAAGGSMGRPHIARALVEAGHVGSVAEAFDTLIGAGKPAYVEKARFEIADAVSMIKTIGGVTSIAHPTLYPDHRRIVPDLLDAGIDAVEVMHPEVDEENREHYDRLVRFRPDKFTTGGSDDHGTVKTKETLGTIRVPATRIRPILDRL